MIGQLYPETIWEKLRHGKLTASKIIELFKEPKTKADKEAGKFSQAGYKYIRTKASEIITGTYRGFESNATDWGKYCEPLAASEIAERHRDFIYYGSENPEFFDFTDWSGGSPDGIKPKTVFEIKCPEDPSNHIEYCDVLDSETLKDIFPDCWHQVQFNMACVAKKYEWSFFDMKGVFVTYSPRVIDGYRKYHEAIIEPDHHFYFNLPKIIERAEIELKKTVLNMKNI